KVASPAFARQAGSWLAASLRGFAVDVHPVDARLRILICALDGAIEKRKENMLAIRRPLNGAEKCLRMIQQRNCRGMLLVFGAQVDHVNAVIAERLLALRNRFRRERQPSPISRTRQLLHTIRRRSN